MAKMLDQSRSEYKATYDELIKFEQDHCTVDAASVSWFSYLLQTGVTFQVTKFQNYEGWTEECTTWTVREVQQEGLQFESHHEQSKAHRLQISLSKCCWSNWTIDPPHSPMNPFCQVSGLASLRQSRRLHQRLQRQRAKQLPKLLQHLLQVMLGGRGVKKLSLLPRLPKLPRRDELGNPAIELVTFLHDHWNMIILIGSFVCVNYTQAGVVIEFGKDHHAVPPVVAKKKVLWWVHLQQLCKSIAPKITNNLSWLQPFCQVWDQEYFWGLRLAKEHPHTYHSCTAWVGYLFLNIDMQDHADQTWTLSRRMKMLWNS